MANWKNISLFVLAVLCAGLAAALLLRPQQALAPAPQAPPAGQPVSRELVLQGRAYCSLTIPVPAQVQGKVSEVLVRVGQAVKKDDLLIKLELLPADAAAIALRASKGQAIRAQELAVQQLELKLAQLGRNISETEQLQAVNLAPRNALPELLEQQALTQRQLEAARLALADARRAAGDDLRVLSEQLGQPVGSGSAPRVVYVRAPQDGHVIGMEPSVVPGALVGGKLCTLGVMDPMLIRGQVHESEIGRLKAGARARITLDAGGGAPVEATLSSVSWSALDSGLAAPSYYLFELTVPNPGLLLRDGNKVQIGFPAEATPPAAPGQPTQ